MKTVEQSLREDNDVLRARIREVMSANEAANLAIADIANECALYVARYEQEKHWKEEDPRKAFNFLHAEFKEFRRLAFMVTTPQTLEHLKKQLTPPTPA